MNNTPAKPLYTEDPTHGISIMIPTRKRPQRLKSSIKSLLDLAHDPSQLEILIAVDNDDKESMESIKQDIVPWLAEQGVGCTCLEFQRAGYANLHVYYNELAEWAHGRWLMIWNDDAVMKSQDWDSSIRSYDDDFCVLAFDTHNKHPYSIFPVIPRAWFQIVGHISNHQMIDAVISQMAYLLDVMIRTDIQVDHERFDLVGEKPDSTYLEREMYEGRPEDPRDLNYSSTVRWRHLMCDRLAWFMKMQGRDISWWLNVRQGKQDPWEKMQANDVNKLTTIQQVRM
jgi:glycosyltransferase involved in cell wall biosynthesis